MDQENLKAGRATQARALFYDAPKQAGIRNVGIPILTEDDRAMAGVLVNTLFSGISRGTERLIFEGNLPKSEWDRMRAPFQEGSFPYPVKYGYSAVGRVEAGPDALLGRTIFALYPHQTHFSVPESAVIPLPDDLPPRRCILAANMETALNSLLDSEALKNHKIIVIGAGVVGCLIAYLAARMPAASVTLVDIDSSRAEIAQALGLDFALPDEAAKGADIIFHTSASESGLRLALELAAFEGRIVEVSWFGDKEVSLPLGGAFHSQRLQIICSQVGTVAKSHRALWTHRQRLETALSLLNDARLDALITEDIAFNDLPAALPRILAPGAPGLATAIHYSQTNS